MILQPQPSRTLNAIGLLVVCGVAYRRLCLSVHAARNALSVVSSAAGWASCSWFSGLV